MAEQIGSLRADLALESASFIRDMNKAAQATAKNTGAMSRNMVGLQKSFSSASTAFKASIAAFVSVAGVRAIASLAKAAVAMADDLGKSARDVGVSAETLQRYRFAAEAAEVSTGDLDTALKLFQKNLASGKIQAQGNSVADAFLNYVKRIEDAGTVTEKTKLATDAAGKSFQSLLRIASMGSVEFNKWAQSAFVVSNDMVVVGQQLDDTFNKLKNAVGTGFAQGMLEGLSSATATSRDNLEALNKAAANFGNLIGGSIAMAIKQFTALDTWLENNLPPWLKTMLIRMSGGNPGGGSALPPLSFEGMRQDLGLDQPDQTPLGDAPDPKALAAAQKELNKALSEGKTFLEQTRTPMEAYAAEIEKLSTLLKQGAIDADTMGRAQTMAAANAVQPWLTVASTIGGALGTLFDDNKAVAIAQAIINTAQGITAALAQYPPPLSFAMAAAQAAAGAAQIATIKSTSPTSKGSVKRPSAAGGSGRAVAAGGGGGGGHGLNKSMVIDIHGKGLLSQEQLEGILDQIRQAQKDGFKIA